MRSEKCRAKARPALLLAALACHSAGAQSLPNLEAFVDGVVGAYMTREQVAGAQVSVVRNGETLLVKGYGIDSAEPPRPVDPNQSLFRLGSLTLSGPPTGQISKT